MFVDWIMQYKEPRDVRMFADLLLQEVNYPCIQGMLDGSDIVCIDDSYPVCCFSDGTNQNFVYRGIFLVILCLDLSIFLQGLLDPEWARFSHVVLRRTCS